MSVRLLVSVSPTWEGELVEWLGEDPGVEVVRRCADLADLLGAGSAGVGEVALVSADLRSLDRAALDHLWQHEVGVVGVVRSGDEDGERRLRQLGVGLVLVLADDAGLDGLPERVARGEGRPARLADEPGSSPTGGTAGGAGTGAGSRAGSLDAGDAIADAVRGGARAPGPGAGAGGERATHEGSWRASGTGPAAGAESGHGAGRGTAAGGGADRAPDAPTEPVRGTVVAVWGPTGAPGRTMLALNLAAETAALGVPTLLVDLDTWGSSIAQSLALLDEAPGVAAAARASEQGVLDLPTLARLAPTVGPGLRVLTGIPRADRWTEVRDAAVEQVLELSRGLAQVVVVDCGFATEDDEVLSYDTLAPRRNGATLTALARADRLLVVGTGDPVGLQRLVRAVQDVARVPSPTPEVVVNRVRASAVGARPERRIREALSRFAGLESPAFVPLDLEAVDASMLAGRPLCEVAPGSPARAAVASIAAGLAGRERLPATRRGRRLARG